ncbi:MAG TPA: nitroreductase [Caulobacteraceae bacterium]|jgi:nitroreductase
MSVNPPPEFGEPLPVARSPETVAFLSRRRSASASGLEAPGPDPEQLQTLLRLAARVPDHGKLFPWRFIVLEGAGKASFVEALYDIARARPDRETAATKLGKVAPAPLAVVVVSRVTPGHKIPEWEQELSAGAVCMNLLTAATALGFGGNWITDWYSYDPAAAALLGLAAGERVAGFLMVGTPAAAPLERPRPELEALVSRWTPPD